MRFAAGPATALTPVRPALPGHPRREGVALEIVATRGVHENLALLQDPKSGIDIALVEGGTTTTTQSPGLVSLGTLYYRPVWIFHRGRMPRPGEPWPAGLRIALGPEGDDSASVSRQLLLESGASLDLGGIRYLERPAAADSLLAGTVDIAAMVAPWESPWCSGCCTAIPFISRRSSARRRAWRFTPRSPR